MGRKWALLLSGIVTAFAMVVVIGLINQAANQPAGVQAASAAESTPAVSAITGDTASTDVTANTGVGQNGADVARLQAELNAYKQQLDKAYSDLQAAYDQIQAMQQQQQQQRRGFRSRGGDD